MVHRSPRPEPHQSDHVVAGAQEAALEAPILAMTHRLHRRAARVASGGAALNLNIDFERFRLARLV